MVGFKLSYPSLKKLTGVHPDLIRTVSRAINVSEIDFGVIQGVRTQEEQNALYDQGRTKPGPIVTWTKSSLHIPQEDRFGHAVDLCAYLGGKISWDEELYVKIAKAMKEAAKLENVDIECGIDWKTPDYGHFQLGKSYRRK